MNGSESLEIRYLIRKGLNLNNNLNDYTEGQVFFCLFCEEREHNEMVLPVESPLTIHGDDEPEIILSKLKGWVGKARGNSKKTDS